MTNQQRKAFHLWLKMLSDEFNEIGLTKEVDLLNWVFELRFTDRLMKEQIIKPLIHTLWEKKSTNELTTNDINEIIDIFNLKFAEIGRNVEFPSFETMLNKLEKEGKLK